MPHKIKQLISGVCLLFAIILSNQSFAQTSGLKINEVLVVNEANYIDDYGVHSSWIEIVNSTYGSVDIGGCYLTDDLNDPQKYWIPKGTPQTVIPTYGYVIFFADNKPTRGVFHVNFDLNCSKTIALFDTDGKTLIDKLEINFEAHKADVSYARVHPKSNEWIFSESTTPGSDNDYSKRVTAGDLFVEMDPIGLGMTIIAMSVVFTALILLFFAFKGTAYIFTRKPKEQRKEVPGEKVPVSSSEISGEVNAAIAMSIYLYQYQAHDFENTVLTVKKVTRPYSPWSSKIYNMRKPLR